MPNVFESGETVKALFESGTNGEIKTFVGIPLVETTPKKILEAEANFKSRDDDGARATREPNLDPTRRAKNDNQLSDLLALGSKATEKLMGRQTRRAMTEGGGELRDAISIARDSVSLSLVSSERCDLNRT